MRSPIFRQVNPRAIALGTFTKGGLCWTVKRTQRRRSLHHHDRAESLEMPVRMRYVMFPLIQLDARLRAGPFDR